MKRFLAACALALLAAPAWCAPKRSPAPPARKPAQPGIVTLAAQPASVTLDGSDAQQRLLITGANAAKQLLDLSRKATYRTSDPKVARVSVDGLVRPTADGAAVIIITAGGKTAKVPVRVRGTKVERPVSFVREVMPVLTQAGCYAATCHAKQGGKAGFQLSVLAFDPEADHTAIVRQAQGRRINRLEPAESLLLRKATLAIPHGGGQRFKVGSPEYRLLARWIAEGARFSTGDEPQLTRVEVEPAERRMQPAAEQQLLVTALYSDGTRRDVTALSQFRSDEISIAEVDDTGRLKTSKLSGEAAIMARFMGQVAVARVTVPQKQNVAPEAYAKLPRFNYIDDLVYRKLSQLNVLPSDLCDDATYLRRAYIDVIGTLPTAEETRAFLKECEAELEQSAVSGQQSAGNPPSPIHPDTHTPKQPALNARARLVSQLLERNEYADYWGMRWSNLMLVNPDLLLPRGAYAFDRWLRDSFRKNMPFDQFAREILTASGETYREGPPNFFRALPKPGDAARSVSQLFLGVRMDCAQCHHHPFERWGQDDFYSLAAFFARVKEKSSYPEGYMSIVYPGSDGEVKHPKTDRAMPCAPPGDKPLQITEGEDRREALVRWMTAPENPYFARTIVNRMWGLLMGRGIVEPVDDFRVSNPASNQPLLDALAKDFVEHKYDLKHLIRTITASAAYQRSCAATPANSRDNRNFARYYKKRLPAEVLLDAIGQVTGVPETFRGHPQGTRAVQMWDSRLQVDFLEIFGRPIRMSVCECERQTDGSVTQLLHMMNSQEMQSRLTSEKGLPAKLAASAKTPEEVITELYLTALSRYPTKEEIAAAQTAFTREKVTKRQATEDVLWALMNSAEFILNH